MRSLRRPHIELTLLKPTALYLGLVADLTGNCSHTRIKAICSLFLRLTTRMGQFADMKCKMKKLSVMIHRSLYFYFFFLLKRRAAKSHLVSICTTICLSVSHSWKDKYQLCIIQSYKIWRALCIEYNLDFRLVNRADITSFRYIILVYGIYLMLAVQL